MFKKLIESTSDVNRFIKYQIYAFTQRSDFNDAVYEVMDKMAQDGDKMSFDEKAKWIAKRLVIGVPSAIFLLKALGYLFAIAWLPV